MGLDWDGGKTALDRRILENRQAANPKPEPLGFVPHDFRRYLSTTMNNRLTWLRTLLRRFSVMPACIAA